MGSIEKIHITGLVLGLGLAVLGPHDHVEAMCGCMMAPEPPLRDAQIAALQSDATMVVLMREGTKTVLSMQNHYKGRPEDFALVVPVPVVLQQSDVKTLPDELFDRVDQRAAPRLVEYWEQDPCNPNPGMGGWDAAASAEATSMRPAPGGGGGTSKSVTVEAQFEVDEYQIVILSAKDSTGLETWLKQENYAIPPGAEPLLRPYVQSGMKFFVAKVDASKVKFDTEGRTKLSPLRFHYDSPEFSLPVRLGLINAPEGPGAKQDLIIHILARHHRYELANYDNVTIPTNLEVADAARSDFASFYASLFDHVLANQPRAIVTEYAGMPGFCQVAPCLEQDMSAQDFNTLGADVLPALQNDEGARAMAPYEFVLTRLHARYDASSLGEDLVFQQAPTIAGGRETLQDDGKLERGAKLQDEGMLNDFHARYAIRHEWQGPIECGNPQRGVWGDPWPGVQSDGAPVVARDLGLVDRNVVLANYLTSAAKQDIEATVGTLPDGPSDPALREGGPASNGAPIIGYGEDQGGCAHCSVGRAGAGGALAFGFGLIGLIALRRKHS